MLNPVEQLEGGGDQQANNKNRHSTRGGENVRGGSFGEDEDDGNEYYDDEAQPQGNDAPFPAPRASVDAERSDSGEEDGEILDENEEERESLKTDEAVEDAAKAWLKKGDEAKKKEMLGFGYKIRPDLDEKFRPKAVQVLIEGVLRDHLDGQTYDGTEMPKMIKVLTDEIQAKMKEQNYSRYKVVTYVILGERRGEGVNAATRCIWDSEADCMATSTFLSDTIFCCATVYGIYYY